MKMPVLFVGHGSPMNAIEDNEFTRAWRALGQEIPRPRAILAISTTGTRPIRANTDEAPPGRFMTCMVFPTNSTGKSTKPYGAPEVELGAARCCPRRASTMGGDRPRHLVCPVPHVPGRGHSGNPAFSDYNLPAEAHVMSAAGAFCGRVRTHLGQRQCGA